MKWRSTMGIFVFRYFSVLLFYKVLILGGLPPLMVPFRSTLSTDTPKKSPLFHLIQKTEALL